MNSAIVLHVYFTRSILWKRPRKADLTFLIAELPDSSDDLLLLSISPLFLGDVIGEGK